VDLMAEIIKENVYNWDIKAIVTFDDYGVSGHANHISVSKGCLKVKEDEDDIKLYNLESVSIFRKYISFFDILFSTFNGMLFINLNLYHTWKSMSIHYS